MKSDKQEQIFFHDLINHTHNLTLFLEQKLSMQEVIDQQEIKVLLDELSLMQLMIADFFSHYKHKNINKSESKSLAFLQPLFDNLIAQYLDQQIVTINCDDVWSDKLYTNHLIVYRIFTNLIKNIAESSPVDVLIELKVKSNFLHCIFDNIFMVPDWKIDHQGMGLESVRRLSYFMGGEYKFSIDRNARRWHTEIIIPLQSEQQLKSVA